MAKKAEDTAAFQVTETTPVPVATKFEFTVFLKDPKGAKACVKAIGTAEVFDDLPAVVQALYVGGYEPDTFGQAKQVQASANGNGGQNTQASTEKPKKFQANGTWWYVNESRKKPGSFYVARKGPEGYEYLKGNDIPQFVRDAYGASLS